MYTLCNCRAKAKKKKSGESGSTSEPLVTHEENAKDQNKETHEVVEQDNPPLVDDADMQAKDIICHILSRGMFIRFRDIETTKQLWDGLKMSITE